MRKCLLHLAILLLFSVVPASAADKEKEAQDIRTDRPFGIGVQMLGPTTIASGYIDLFLGPHLNIEAGLGMLGFYGGAKYFFSSASAERRWFPYTGAMVLFIPGIMSADDTIGFYLPLGIQYMLPWGLLFGAELAVMGGERGIIPYGGLRTAIQF